MFTANYLSHQRTRVLHTNPAPTEGTGEPRHYEFTLPFQDYRGLFFISAVSKWIECTCICHDRWKTLAGDDSICECCDSQCVTSKPRRAMMEGRPIVVVFLFPSLDQISRTHTFPLWLVGHVVAALTCTTPLADNYQKLSRMNESDHKCSFIY